MKARVLFVLFFMCCVFSGCESEVIAPDAVSLSVDFTWEGMKQCEWGNPEIQIDSIPENTHQIKIHMYDHAYYHDHGTVVFPYEGTLTIEKDRFKSIQGPCPLSTPGRYEITVYALDESGIIIGKGEKERRFPES